MDRHVEGFGQEWMKFGTLVSLDMNGRVKRGVVPP
jgi:hypothetical protein